MYLRAQNCTHQFERGDAVTQVCRGCGVMRHARTPVFPSIRPVWQRWFRSARPSVRTERQTPWERAARSGADSSGATRCA
ncbi:hypothetical protein HNQ08_003076 [Deinococcus humi]|uniref:Uncharacterized protein n=1 Tax=Deinococcus humi TaxID=662880 RepID=A0A7W8JYD3_9DEIO|nr:hypothetical protein [Deinococcus humi]